MSTRSFARYSETYHDDNRTHEVDERRLTVTRLAAQNRRFEGTGGVSGENRTLGFLPAFADICTGAVYLSRFADGRLAPMHLLEGLPEKIVEQRGSGGRVTMIKDSVIAGFVRDGQFYTREQAARVATKH